VPAADGRPDVSSVLVSRYVENVPTIPPVSDFKPVAKVADIPVGTMLSVTLPNGEQVLVMNVDGDLCALPDRCSHEELELSAGELLPGGIIECAFHGAQFDCRTGAVRSAPAFEDLPTYPVRVEDGTVLVGPRRGPR
jgi:3-phenylpropionate/trans-cinnamate dioxygenase ferredoxin subunit